MRPLLDSFAASGLGGVGGDIQWSHTIGRLGKTGLLVVYGGAREEGGEENPEEINGVFIIIGGQVWLTRVDDANSQEFGSGMYILPGSQIPAPGTYTIGINFKDSPKQAEKKRGVSAAFVNVKPGIEEVKNKGTGTNTPRTVTLTPLTPQALVVAGWGWRVGFAETWSWGTKIVTSRGDNALGMSLAYAVVPTPALQTVTCGATNPEDNGMVVASFPYRKVTAGQII